MNNRHRFLALNEIDAAVRQNHKRMIRRAAYVMLLYVVWICIRRYAGWGLWQLLLGLVVSMVLVAIIGGRHNRLEARLKRVRRRLACEQCGHNRGGLPSEVACPACGQPAVGAS